MDKLLKKYIMVLSLKASIIEKKKLVFFLQGFKNTCVILRG